MLSYCGETVSLQGLAGGNKKSLPTSRTTGVRYVTVTALTCTAVGTFETHSKP